MSARNGHAAAKVRHAEWRQRAQDVKLRVPLADVVGRHVKLQRKAGSVLQGLCPFHSERTPSFHVYPRDHHFHCYGCSAHGDVIGFVMRVDGLAFQAAIERLEAEGGQWTPREGARRAHVQRATDRSDIAGRIVAAGRIWQESRALNPGDHAWRYLMWRGLSMHVIAPLLAEDTLRYHPALTHPDFPRERTWPGLVARVTNHRGEFLGVHRTYLERTNAPMVRRPDEIPKGQQKCSIGPLSGGAVRLFNVPLSGEIGLAEGVEDALSIYQLTQIPTWSCIDAGKLANVQLEFGISDVVIFADRDPPQLTPGRERATYGIGLKRAAQLAKRLRGEARNVEIRWPREAKDYSDIVATGLPA